jgi:transcription elongation factor Elf1
MSLKRKRGLNIKEEADDAFHEFNTNIREPSVEMEIVLPKNEERVENFIVEIKSKSIVETEVSDKYSCELCEASFEFQSDLLMHKLRHTAKDNVQKLTETATTKQIVVIREKFSCPDCNRCYTDSIALEKHLPSHALKCLGCELVFKSQELLDEHITDHECFYCDQLILTSKDLEYHRILHKDLIRYNCDCGRTFKNRSSLKEHKRRFHGEKSNFQNHFDIYC